jgi:peptidoglycan hydrolase CwlO-like protein
MIRRLTIFVIFMLGLPILSYAQQNPYAQGGTKTYAAEQQTKDIGQNQANLMLNYENMLTKIGELTGKIEELRHGNELLQNKIDKMNVKIGNLENEINTLKGRVHVSTPPEVPVVRDEEKKAAYRLDAKKAYDGL